MNIIFRLIALLFVALFISVNTYSDIGLNRAKYLEAGESRHNFKLYEAELKSLADEYGYELTKEVYSVESYNSDDQVFYDISLNGEKIIGLSFSNSSFLNPDTTIGRERFGVEMLQRNGDYDYELFVRIVNMFSGKKITEDFCREKSVKLKKDCENDLENVGKRDSYSIYKPCDLTFFQDWTYSYTITESCEMISFGGLTDNGTNNISQ